MFCLLIINTITCYIIYNIRVLFTQNIQATLYGATWSHISNTKLQ